MIGFEAARGLERLLPARRDPLDVPWMRLDLFDAAVVLDHARHEAFAVCAQGLREALGLPPRPVAGWLEVWRTAAHGSAAGFHAPHSDARLALRGNVTVCDSVAPDSEVRRYDATPRGSAGAKPSACGPAAPGWGRGPAASPVRHGGCEGPAARFLMPRSAYESRVERIRAYIAAGDIYQANFAQAIALSGLGDALEHYAQLRQVNPAPHAALLRWNDLSILSLSPELFLRLRGRDVLTRPIKGTRPRTGDPARDGAFRRALIASPKEAAELAMIVDLHRNDLGRVCAYGSVRVPRPRTLEAHPTVYHTVADVTGRLADRRDGLDLLAACFPAGSISGVPKIRAIQIITELEPLARGAYTGAVGNLALDGDLTFNVAIRTLQFRGQAGTLYVGGGIVAESDAAAEYEETIAKARGLLRGLDIEDVEPAVERPASAASPMPA